MRFRLGALAGSVRRSAGRRMLGEENAHVALAALIRRRDTTSRRYGLLCLQLGLISRFENYCRHCDIAGDHELQVARAVVSGQTDTGRQAMQRAIAEHRAGTLAVAPLWRTLERGWHLCPDLMIGLYPEVRQTHPVWLAVEQVTGRHMPGLRELHPVNSPSIDAHLLMANHAETLQQKMGRIDRALQLLGQRGIQLKDGASTLRIDAIVPPSIGAGRHDGPLVSVIMTCFNNADLVGAAMRSALAQTWPHLELIVVDDASTDNSPRVMEEVAESDDRVRVIRLRENRGTYGAKNIGLAEAKGEYVAFNDADDWAHPERLQFAVRSLATRPSLVGVTGHYFRLAGDGRIVSPRLFPLVRWSPNSLIFRRRLVLDTIGAFQETRFGGDSEYVARLRAKFGEQAHLKMSQIHFVAVQRTDSLMHGAAYGLDSFGYSAQRATYQESWSERILESLLST